MKNLLLTHCTALFCSLFLFNATTAQTEYKLDSLQQFDLDISSMTLLMKFRSHNTFGNNGTKETYQLSLIKDMSVWNNSINWSNTYDSNNNIVSQTLQSWDPDNSVWINFSKSDFEYDTAQNNTLLTGSITFDNGVSWTVFSQNQMQYNSNNLITVNTAKIFDFFLNSLVNSSKTLYSYTNMHNTETIHQNWNGTTSQWVNFEKDVITYSGNLITQEDRYHWATNNWDAMPFEREVLTYNGSEQLLTLTTLVNNSGTLVNSDKVTNSYVSNRLAESIYQTWNISTATWNNSERTTFAYDGNGNPNEYISYDWTASNWRNSFKVRQFWSVASPFNLGVEDQDLAVLKVFPNPFHDILEFRLKKPLDSEGQIQVFDIYGKEITSTHLSQGQDNVKLDLNRTANGMYIVNFNTIGQHKSFKVVKQ